MGGSIAVTLVTPNGTMYKMCRWTNTLPWFVKNPKFISKDEQHINEYLDEWIQMKSDFEANGPNGPFQYSMTSVYLPYQATAPCGYGLVLIDMQQNKIYSSQGYCSFSEIHKKTYDKEAMQSFEALKKQKRLTKHVFDNTYKLDLSPFEVVDYGESKEGLEQMYEDIKSNYALDATEHDIWRQYLSDDE